MGNIYQARVIEILYLPSLNKYYFFEQNLIMDVILITCLNCNNIYRQNGIDLLKYMQNIIIYCIFNVPVLTSFS